MDYIRIQTSWIVSSIPAEKKKCHWDFDKDCTVSVDDFGYYGYLTILSLLMQGHGYLYICLSLI